MTARNKQPEIKMNINSFVQIICMIECSSNAVKIIRQRMPYTLESQIKEIYKSVNN